MTRAALLTPPTSAGLATVQIVGPAAQAVIDSIFHPLGEGSLGPLQSDRLRFGTICDANEIIDQVIIASDPAAGTVEISCHGGPRIVQRLLLLLEDHGIDITTWQDLISPTTIAEEVAHALPHALTRLAALAIAAQHPTGLAAAVEDAHAKLLAHPESLVAVKDRLAALLPTFFLGQKLLTPATVVLTGPTNTGKSTLANALSGRTQSITADMPGTTRDYTEQLVDLNGIPVCLVDTAGRGQTGDQLQAQAQARADQQIATAAVVVVVYAPAQVGVTPTSPPEHIHFDAPQGLSRPSLAVLNKSDLLKPGQAPDNCLAVSALTATGLDELRRDVVARLGFARFDPAAPLVFTPRQHQLLTSAATASSSDEVLAFLQTLLEKE